MQFLSDSHGCQGWSGEMAARILAFDWSKTDLGPIAEWTPSLRSAVQFLLASPVPLVMLWGRAGYMIYNDAYSVFAGGRHPYLLGTQVELGWPEVADFNRNIVDTCLAGGTLTYRDKSLELLRHGVPEEVWLDLYYSPVPGDDGEPAGVMAVVVEITDRINAERLRHDAEDAYRGTNERLQLALNTGALLGCYVWDVGANEVTGDERFARTFSLPVERCQQGLPIEAATVIIHPDDVERVTAAIQYTVENGGPYNAEYRIRRPDGSYLWILASGRCELDEQGRALRFPGVLIDIHERKIAEEALLQLTRNLEQRVSEEVQARSATEERLRQSQKLEAIGGLTGGVAHDFNNVLQVISGNLQLLARKERDNPNVQRHVNAALGAVERGAKLSAQLLAFARRQPLSPAAYNPRRIYEGLGELLQRALGETIQMEVQLPSAPWCIHVDRNQLENALLNLAINARDAMQGEGTIVFNGENVILNAPQCVGKDIAPGDYVRLGVSDSGAGMSTEILQRAFEPFFTTKPNGQGTGLGLSMVFGFVKQSGGHIEMSSEEGRGTTVLMYFPRSQELAQDEEGESVDLQVGGRESILVVEDDEAVRSTTVELLQQLGYAVLVAGNGDAALEILQSGAQVDLVFTDVVMPGQVKSIDLAIWARQQKPPIPVLFTSGHTRDIISRDNELDADTHLLSKPYSPDALTAMVRMVLNG
ncbi:PAS domain-containing protein [Pseudomonas sp. PDM14]|uniref:hybrid sensor histidine kinase/response regulator n=1 Tax=Pseudomonas sp. PDM14 TaxID=2769288 RepID=UPI001783E1BB|nr:ATP-binding protein [Pseudomonas sp. PDM14]MBD9481508.1 PAS domain-containing protein [Pseudomonas sp. PDM14]